MAALVDDYFVIGDTNDTNSFVRALGANSVVLLRDRTYNVSDTINVASRKQLRGEGEGISVVRMTTRTKPVFTIASDAKQVTFDRMSITRDPASYGLSSGTAGDGIQCLGPSEGVTLSNLELKLHYRGFLGRNTNGGFLRNVQALHCDSNGIDMLFDPNLAVPTPLQWSTFDCAALFCSGNGLHIHSSPYSGAAGTYAGISLGTHYNFTTFANAGCGIKAEGNGRVALHSLRIINGFMGEDGQDEIWLDGGPNNKMGSPADQAYRGTNHVIKPVFIELAGRGYSGPYKDLSETLTTRTNAVGRDLGLAAGRNACGINVRHAINVVIAPTVVNGSDIDGIFSYNVTGIAVQNAQISHNGQAAVSGRMNGIYLYESERQMIEGNRVFGNNYALAWGNNDIIIGGNDFRFNNSGAYAGPGATSLPNSASYGNLPSNV